MYCLRCLRASLPSIGGPRPILSNSTFPRIATKSSLQSSSRSFTLLALRRPQISIRPSTLECPSTIVPAITTSLLAHPATTTLQVRNHRRATYDPSHRVRKRRHGFLARNRTRKGRATLLRRREKGRSALSH